MSDFVERLKQAAAHAGVGDSQSDIARALELKRQTVNRWFVVDDAEPEGDLLFEIASRFGVNPKWLKSGDGPMYPDAANEELSNEEHGLIKDYRGSSPKIKEAIRAMVRAMRKVATVVVAAVPPLLAHSPSDATAAPLKTSGAVYYVKSRLRAVIQMAVRLLTPPSRLTAA